YVFGDYCSGRIWFATPATGIWMAEEWANTALNISSFGEDEGGELYVVDLNGSLYRFVSPNSVFADDFESGDVSQWSDSMGG
ncbi:MAG: hypothetical protein P8Y93_12295, partial [Acidobacteriota bacterium]